MNPAFFPASRPSPRTPVPPEACRAAAAAAAASEAPSGGRRAPGPAGYEPAAAAAAAGPAAAAARAPGPAAAAALEPPLARQPAAAAAPGRRRRLPAAAQLVQPPPGTAPGGGAPRKEGGARGGGSGEGTPKGGLTPRKKGGTGRRGDPEEKEAWVFPALTPPPGGGRVTGLRSLGAPLAPPGWLSRPPAALSPQPLLKQSPWSNHQSSGWSTGSVAWGAVHGRDHRRAGTMGIPGPLNQISPLKKPFSGNVIAPPKFTRSTPSLTPKSWMEDNVFRTDSNSNTLLPLQVRSSLQLPAWGSDSLQDSWCPAAGTSRIDQDRSRMYDSLNMHSLENSLIDIMRAEHDPLKGRLSYPHPGTDNLLMLNGRSSLFPIDDGLLDDGHSDQVGVLNSPTCYSAHQNGERIERFSRKVFVGGLPPDIDEDEITASFRRFGPLVVDWPHKAESKSYFPPKGYAFLLFQEESSVQALIDACIEEDGKLYLCVSSPTIKDKPVQIRPWNLSDSDFVMDGSQPLDPRKTIFVGGVPRPLRAVELAMIMDRLYGGVCYAGIDTDPELKYPKGAGRVAFSNQQSYIAAISARFVQLQHGDIDKRVEVKPYVLDDQMCDECQGARCGGKFAPFFCANVTCLQYYCEFCWANIHSRAGREFHKPLVKEGADRPRQIHFRWN
uniref:Cytoplasmic polyadenylation element binding protein 2 n=1 Tax=Sarcophilus harrisii TaxID=9305 RepID=A0A7N4NW23_SARHA